MEKIRKEESKENLRFSLFGLCGGWGVGGAAD